MKKVGIILFTLMVSAASVSAQKIIVGGGIGYYHPYYYHPYYWHPYYGLGLGYGYPYYARPGYYYRHPSRLDRQVMDIEHDYDDRISSVRMDNSLTGRERRHEIRDLRHQRDAAIDDARRNYYKRPYDNNYNNNNNDQ